MKSSSFKPSIDSYHSEFDLNSFKKCFEEIDTKIAQMLQGTKSGVSDEKRYQASFDLCNKILTSKVSSNPCHGSFVNKNNRISLQLGLLFKLFRPKVH
jgi:hypothetical protein